MSKTRAASTLVEAFTRTTELHASARALLSPAGWLTFEQVSHLAGAANSLFTDSGAMQGDRVVIVLENSLTARILDQAVLSSGLVRVAVSPRLHAREIAAITADAEAGILCCDVSRVEDLSLACAEAAVSCQVIGFSDAGGGIDLAWLAGHGNSDVLPVRYVDPSDMAMLMYSSGTTGTPKGAIVTHESWMAQMRNASAHLPQIDDTDTVVLAAPMQHFGGSIGLDCALWGAATIVLVPFDAAAVLAAVQHHEATVLPLVPTLLTRLMADLPARPLTPSTLRVIPYGGSPADTQVLLKAARHFPACLTQFYGLAEALAPLAVLSPSDHDRALGASDGAPSTDVVAVERLRSAGQPVDSVNWRLDGASIQVRGDIVMPGYWRRGSLTEAVLNEGWFSTGDRGRLDGDGYLYLLDRESDLIITGGFNVYPGEVEQVIRDIDGIADVAIVGLPHPTWGEGIHAFVILNEFGKARFAEQSLQLKESVRRACLASLASYKKPIGLHVLELLPRNPAGKVDRTALKTIQTFSQLEN